nr:anaphase-promoting complex subunit 8-like [Ipomoea batatas]
MVFRSTSSTTINIEQDKTKYPTSLTRFQRNGSSSILRHSRIAAGEASFSSTFPLACPIGHTPREYRRAEHVLHIRQAKKPFPCGVMPFSWCVLLIIEKESGSIDAGVIPGSIFCDNGSITIWGFNGFGSAAYSFVLMSAYGSDYNTFIRLPELTQSGKFFLFGNGGG